jgi:glycosyltransferase involved in cell wall biosynthesis
MEKVKPLILIICDYYLPGFESGGAMRTIVNMVERLSDEYRFKIITRDHDGPLNRASYTDVKINDWNAIEKARVYYLSKNSISLRRIGDLTRETRPDAIYLNSFFSPLTIFTLLLRRFRIIDRIPIILAPEGELVAGALSIKSLKKQLYIRFAKLLGVLKPVIWKAAAEFESDSIEEIFGKECNILIAPNMPSQTVLANFDLGLKPKKQIGELRLVFLSRFMRKKNFKWLLDHLQDIDGYLSIDIYGPIEDGSYWKECQQIIKTLPATFTIQARGGVSHEDVPATLVNYHFFVLPTLGENFGHIFIEALAAGCPLLISDRTPWRDLEKDGVGWDLPLEDPEKWKAVVEHCVSLSGDEYLAMSERARNFAVAWLSNAAHEKANRRVLEIALKTSADSGLR